jgi:RHS repeat-associated protein
MGYWYQDSVSTSLSRAATYTFDGVNRPATAVATGNSTYSQSYNYTSDSSNGQFGNMSCTTGSSGYCPQVTFSSSTNRITNIGSASASYDAAGNMTNDGSHNYTWDAEGRVVTVDGGSTRTFTYNALGERVEWAYPGGAAEMLFDPSGTWLGQAGNYSLVNFGGGHGVTYGGGETYFNHYNSLGSSSMQTKHDGSVVGDIAFYPFGTVWAQPLSGYGYNFASLPARDLASNTDITAFRQYNFTLGRWLGPDPLGGHITNPQSFNRYAYVLNNPLSAIDPLGLDGPYTAPATNPCGWWTGATPGSYAGYAGKCQQQYAAAWAAALANYGSGCLAGEYGCGAATSNSSASLAYGADFFDAMLCFAQGNTGCGASVGTDALGNIGFTVNPYLEPTQPTYTPPTTSPSGEIIVPGYFSWETWETAPTSSPNLSMMTLSSTFPSAASDSGFSIGSNNQVNFQPAGFTCVTCGPWTDGGMLTKPMGKPATATAQPGSPAATAFSGAFLPGSAPVFFPVPSSP